MWGWLERRARERRAKNFLRLYPRDEPALFEPFRVSSSVGSAFWHYGDAAEMTNGRKLAEAEWASYANRWERAWRAIVPRRAACKNPIAHLVHHSILRHSDSSITRCDMLLGNARRLNENGAPKLNAPERASSSRLHP
jgi:hypothetical protein